jgi:hypothetical protein
MPTLLVPALILIVLAHAMPVVAQPLDEPNLFTYVRLGTSAVMADGVRRAPAVGFGMRAELERFAIDVSGLNFALNYDARDPARELAVGSVLKIQALKFLTPGREGSGYVGGGVSWGYVSVGRAARSDGLNTSWHGRGLQGEFTIGYEVPRSSAIRFLVQADASMPFFAARSETFTYPSPGNAVSTGRERRLIPSLALSVGVGWRRR